MSDNYYFDKDNKKKYYSKEAIEYAKNRVNYEMSYTYGMDFTDEQKKWIQEHIYFSVRKAYNDGYNKHMEEIYEKNQN